MTGAELSAEETERLAGSLAWHFDCHAEFPTGSYKSLGIQNALMIVELTVAARVAAVEAERDEVQASLDHWQHAAKIEAARLREQRDRAEAAEAEVARLTAELAHYREFFAPDVEALTATWQATVDQTVEEANRQLAEKDAENRRLTALVEAGLALADEWDDFEHDMSACQKYDCGDCTMKNAVHDLRAALGGTA